jgi:predicted nuclease of predicted toxin-antitoxin system
VSEPEDPPLPALILFASSIAPAPALTTILGIELWMTGALPRWPWEWWAAYGLSWLLPVAVVSYLENAEAAPAPAPPAPARPAEPRPPAKAPVRFFCSEGTKRPKPRCAHLDECCPGELADILRDGGCLATTAGDGDLLGAEDERHLEFAFERRVVLVSYDRDFLILDGTGHPHCGVVIAPKGATPRQVADFLFALAAAPVRP